MTPALEAAYAEPHRRYHTRAHIDDCLKKLGDVQGLTAEERRLLTCAIWWHDAVYDATRPDNEEASAAMAERDLQALGEDAAFRIEVARLILLTKGHAVAPDDRLGAILVSIDLSILGEAPQVYDAYVAAVRQEYAHVPDEAWRVGRGRVMQHFLSAPVLYADPDLRARFETQARANLARELSSLSA